MSTPREPWNSAQDSSDDWAPDSSHDRTPDERVDLSHLPLEMYFAEAPAERDRSFESAVLSQVGRRRGFVSRTGRRFVSTARYGMASLALTALIAAAVADRLGVFRSAADAESRPVSSLVESAADTVDPLMSVSLVSDGLRDSFRDSFPSGWSVAASAETPCVESRPTRLVIGAQAVASVAPTRVHRAGVGWQAAGWAPGVGDLPGSLSAGPLGISGMPGGGVWTDLLEAGDATIRTAAEPLAPVACTAGPLR